MLDKIVIVNKNQAFLVYDNKRTVSISSDEDVTTLVLWILGDKRVQLSTTHSGKTSGIEMRRDTSDEVTVNINTPKVA